ncbi:MAG: hypothetical protein Q8Q09_12635 [Deltaproteobacteria bacterium]|nr:hypothetical protein [Deltaproteobacteria bacterium]
MKSNKPVGCLVGALLSIASTANAQSAPPAAGAPAPQPATESPPPQPSSQDQNATVSDNARVNAATTGPESLPLHSPDRLLMRDVGSTLSLGWRMWGAAVPTFIIGLFAKVEGDWAGGGGLVTGPELVYRNGAVDIVLGVQYVGYYSGYGHLRGINEPVSATEQIKADLWSIQFTSHFLYGIRAGRYFEFQIGAGIGAGFIGGTLNRYQARQTADGSFEACLQSDAVPIEPCNSRVNNHFAASRNAQGQGSGGYQENNWITNGGGYVPLIMPWLSLPHMAFHFRPHRHFDFRVEGGYNLIGFYGGGSMHYVF